MQEKKSTILVVDDSDTQRQLLTYLLNNAHYQTLEAKNGAEGLKLAHEKIPDLIITDILMPVMDGYELVHRIKQDETFFDTQIIFYTGHYHEKEAKSLADLFGSYYLNKPASKRELLNTIEQALQKKTKIKLSQQDFDEISKKHLNLMTNKLYQRVRELEQLNVELEQRVFERTRELEILNKKLYEESSRDPLTGLFNRRYLEDILLREIARSKRHKRLFWVVIMDLDHFKQINDKYGHRNGDVVLYNIAQFLKSSLRTEDIICRYGGDEFVLILLEMSEHELYPHLDMIRTEISHLQIKSKEILLKNITVSMGVAANIHELDTIDSVIDAADNALYQAKQAGRNCILTQENHIKTLQNIQPPKKI